MIKQIIKLFVGLGTAMTVSSVTKSLQNTFIQKKTGLAGTCQDISLFAARTAITFKAVDTMDAYVEQCYDATTDACKKALKAISEIGEATNAKNIDISTKTEEDSDNGEANTKDSTETSNN
jgi:hypothetical protein